jgi:hypothetical protein
MYIPRGTGRPLSNQLTGRGQYVFKAGGPTSADCVGQAVEPKIYPQPFPDQSPQNIQRLGVAHLTHLPVLCPVARFSDGLVTL